MKRSNKPQHRPPARAHRTTARRSEDPTPLNLGILLKSALITVGVGIGLTLTASLCAYFYSDPNVLILPLGLIASALTALIGGILSARMHGNAPLLCGLCNGTAVTAVMILASLFFRPLSMGYSALVSAGLHAGFLGLSVAGAYLGRRREGTHKRRRP